MKTGLLLLFSGISLSLAAANAPFTITQTSFQPGRKQITSVQNGVFSCTETKPNRYTNLAFKLDRAYDPALICTFEYRIKVNGANVKYLGVNFFYDRNKSTFNSFPVKADWSPARIALAEFRNKIPSNGMLKRMTVYARAAEGALTGCPTVEVRNVRFAADPKFDPMRGMRISYSAYPMFDWRTQPGAEKYRIEFNGKTAEVRENFFVPAQPLPPGLVNYTVTALPSGKVMERNSLVIPERNLRWKLPEYDFASFAKLPHPRFRKLAEYWTGDVPNLVKAARRNAARPLPPEPQPYKEGADPKIRARIEWYGKIAGGVIAATGSRLVTIGQAAILSGDPALKQAAKEKALGVAKWDPNGGTHMRHTDLHTAWLLRGLIWCYDAAYDVMTPQERKTVQDCIRERGNQFYHNVCPFRLCEAQNHPWDRVEAAMFATLALAEEPGMAERYKFGASVYAYRIFPSLGFDGENNEGLQYWSYGLGLAVRYTDVAKHTAGLDFYSQPWLKKTARFPMYCYPPCGLPVSFSDNGKPNHSGKGPLNRPFTAKLAASGGDPAALWYAGYPEKDGVQAKIPLDVPQSVSYPHIGWSVFNTFLPDGRENVAVGFHAGKYFAGHQHADQNSFVINAYGDKLAIDGGYYDWWGSKHFKAYSTQTVAHNSILADGKGQDVRVYGSDGETKMYFDAPHFGFVSGTAEKTYQDRVSRFERDLLFVKPDYVFTFDRLAAPKPTVFSYLMHSHTVAPIQQNGNDFAIARPLAGLTGSILLPRDAKSSVAPAYTVMPVNGYSVDPAPNRQKEWCFTAANPQPVRQTEFLCAMRVQRGPDAKTEKRWTVEENAGAVLVKGKDVEVLFNRTPGKTVRLGKFVTDARCAAVILENGKVADAMKTDGKVFSYGTVKAANTGSWSMGKAYRTTGKAVLTLNGKEIPLALHEIRYPFGKKIFVMEGTIDVPENGYAAIRSDAGCNYLVSNQDALVSGTLKAGESGTLLLHRGKVLFCASAGHPLGKIVLDGGKSRIAQLDNMPENWKPAAGTLVIEAETPSRENMPVGLTDAREYASGGRAQISWSASGKYAEWDFTVPQTGKYRLYVRYATEHGSICRELMLDGHAVRSGIACLQFQPTGGWGRGPGEWQYAALPGTVQLKAGKHTLKFTVLKGDGNLDCFALEPVK